MARAKLSVSVPTSRWLMIEQLVAVQVLDRVLERDDVARPGRVDVVDHRRQRGRLARAGGPGEQDDPALLLGERADHRRRPRSSIVRTWIRDRPAGDRDAAALAKGVDAKARDAADRVGEVDLADSSNSASIRVLEDLAQGGVGVLGGQRLHALHRPQLAVDARHRRRRHLDVQVRALGLDHMAQRCVDVEHRPFYRRPTERLERCGRIQRCRRGAGTGSRPGTRRPRRHATAPAPRRAPASVAA